METLNTFELILWTSLAINDILDLTGFFCQISVDSQVRWAKKGVLFPYVPKIHISYVNYKYVQIIPACLEARKTQVLHGLLGLFNIEPVWEFGAINGNTFQVLLVKWSNSDFLRGLSNAFDTRHNQSFLN